MKKTKGPEEYPWIQFGGVVSSKYWKKNIGAHRTYLEWLANTLHIKELESWYNIPNSTVRKVVDSNLLKKYGGSLANAVISNFPEYEWCLWKFCSLPSESWKDPSMQRDFLEWIYKELRLKGMEDWYEVRHSDVKSRGGNSLLNLYGGSIASALSFCYPEYDWMPWRFASTSTSYWQKKENQKLFLDWFSEEFGIKDLEDWHQVKPIDIQNRGGAWLISHYGGMAELLSFFYPDHHWKPWKFGVSKEYFSIPSNQRNFMDWASKKLDVQTKQDWYSIKTSEIRAIGGSAILDYFHGSMFSLLLAIYPEYEWQPWRFNKVPNNYWKDLDHQKKYIAWLTEELQIR